MINQSENNRVLISGRVATEPRLTHELFNEGFYEFEVEAKRLSNMVDLIPITISERLLPKGLKEGDLFACKGQFRSHNIMDGDRSRLLLTLFVQEMIEYNETNTNSIDIDGYICKQPIYRTTPFKREICDVLIAVNRNYNKSDYIPCIAWGRNARFVGELDVGTHLKVSGRIQSREYQKVGTENQVEKRTAYEVSIVSVSKVATDELDVDTQNTSMGEVDDYYRHQKHLRR